jgi:hypothetical protein
MNIITPVVDYLLAFNSLITNLIYNERRNLSGRN